MLRILFFIVLGATTYSCDGNTQSGGTGQEVAVGNLQPGPIRNDALSKEQLENIKLIHEAFVEVLPVSLEETVENFKRDQNPDTEITVWLNMAKTYQAVLANGAAFDDPNKRIEVFRLILMRSMMSDKEAVEAVELEFLTETETKEILGMYLLDIKPISVE